MYITCTNIVLESYCILTNYGHISEIKVLLKYILFLFNHIRSDWLQIGTLKWTRIKNFFQR